MTKSAPTNPSHVARRDSVAVAALHVCPGATRVDPGSCFGACSTPCEGTAGTMIGPAIAGVFGAGRAGQLSAAEPKRNFGHIRAPCLPTLIFEGELGEF